MTFDVSPELQALLQRVEEKMESVVYPLEDRAREDFQAALPVLLEARAALRAEGFCAPHMPKEIGGMGLSFLDHARMSEILGRSPIGHFLFNCPAPDAGNMEVLHKFGSPEQKKRFLEPLVRGEIRSCFSMTEPDRAGSNPTWLETVAVREGDEYVVTGRKWFTTAGHLADFAIVMAVTNPDEKPHRRASFIIVPCDTPGFKHVRRIPIMGEPGYGWSSHSEIEYDHVRVPVTNRVGEEGAGFSLAQERLGPGRIHHCMRWLGICERALDLLCKRAVERELAPGKRLADEQVIRHWIAESRAEIDAARLYVYSTANKIDREGTYAARVEVSSIKFFVAGVLQRVVDRAIQVHGALGITEDTPLSWFYRHERGARIYDGPDEVHKDSVAKHVLKRYVK
jgi:acyl-CoA dehydrogenase